MPAEVSNHKKVASFPSLLSDLQTTQMPQPPSTAGTETSAAIDHITHLHNAKQTQSKQFTFTKQVEKGLRQKQQLNNCTKSKMIKYQTRTATLVRRSHSFTSGCLTKIRFTRNLLTLPIILVLSIQLAPLFSIHSHSHSHSQQSSAQNYLLPRIVLAEAADVALPSFECSQSADCKNYDKICHENKCLCPKNAPIEDALDEYCLKHSELNEPCNVTPQCLGDAQCIDGVCTCSESSISVPNPSRNISYCHPRRTLNEKCNFDAQCPLNAYCTDKCLCLNGYAPQLHLLNGVESLECLPKFCTTTSTCEEFHVCQESRCLCLPAHFDVKNARCHKFGYSSDADDDDLNGGANNSARPNDKLVNHDENQEAPFYTVILRDLSQFSDSSPLALFALAALILIFVSLCICGLIYILIRRPFKRWTAQKNEFEPNNNDGAIKKSTNGSNFNKSCINNKSFRKKSSDFESDDDENVNQGEDHSKLVSETAKKLSPTTQPATTTTTTTIQKKTTTTSIMIDIDDVPLDASNDKYARNDGVAAGKLAASPLLAATAKSTAV